MHSPIDRARELAVAAYDARGGAAPWAAIQAFAARYTSLPPSARTMLRAGAGDSVVAALMSAAAAGRPLTSAERGSISSAVAQWRASARGRSAPSSSSAPASSAQQRYRGYPRRSRYRGESSQQRRERHVREAQELSAELGGADEDVKAYFFQLSPKELKPILDAYEREYGTVPRQYAEEAFPKWRSRERRMSGMVASRLFSLLPPRMPLEIKYSLTKTLWNHVGPSSRKQMRAGPNAGLDEAIEAIRAHISNVVVHYKIPPNLERRFEWITARDVQLKQLLLNRLLDEEVELVVSGIRAEFPVWRRFISGSTAEQAQRLARTVRIGKHELELVFDRSIEGVQMETPAAAPPNPLRARSALARSQPTLAPQTARTGESREAIWGWAAAGALTVLLALILVLSAGE